MAPRIARSNLELKDDAKLSYRALTLFPGLWIRGYFTKGPRIRSSEDQGIR
jgi:inosine/xanthosine triphosphate pyrophosphatase family protein